MNTQFTVSSSPVESRKDRLVKDLRGVVADTDTLLKDVVSSTAEEFDEVRAKVEGHLGEARTKVDNVRIRLSERARHAAGATQGYVMEHPWKAIGVAAAAGLVASYFLKRR